MTDPLIAFLIELDKNEALKQEYIANPKEVAEAHGLPAEDVDICVNNDLESMKLRAEAEGAETINIAHAN